MKKAIAVVSATLLLLAAASWSQPAPRLFAGHGDIEIIVRV